MSTGSGSSGVEASIRRRTGDETVKDREAFRAGGTAAAGLGVARQTQGPSPRGALAPPPPPPPPPGGGGGAPPPPPPTPLFFFFFFFF